VQRDQQFVAQLNPEDFNKVEVVTNPGVEYDADVEAVINIVLKKAPTGGRGSINVTAWRSK
jgi:transposase